MDDCTPPPPASPPSPPAAEAALLPDIFERAVAAHPDALAVDVPPSSARTARQSITYRELHRQILRVAAHLRPGVRREGVVAILLPRNTHLLYVAELAVLYSGAAYTAIDPAFPDERLRFIVEDSGAVALLTDPAGGRRAVAAVVDPGRILDVARLIAAPPPADPGGPAPPWLTPRSLAYVIYTSGTTGQPKGVMIEHRSIVNLVLTDQETFALSPGDRVAQGSSPAYDSSVEEIWLAFAAGATLVVMDDEAVRLGPDLGPWLRRERISVLCPPPTLLRSTGIEDPAAALPDLRLVYAGGEPLPRDIADRWSRGRWFENGYGPTECTVTVVRGRIREGAPITIGRPVRGHRAWVVNDALDEVPDEAPGELCIGGIGLARGYLNRPELDAGKFPEHPRFGRIYRTGDLVRRTAAGDLEYLGRIDSQVKVRGHRLELEEVEANLCRCPGVREAASRLQGEGRDQILVGYVVPERSDAPPDVERIKDVLRRALPEPMVPSRIMILTALPTTTGGKLDRRALPVVGAPARARDPRAPAPGDPLERRIADAIRSGLKIDAAIAVDDDFFDDLGGDSLAAALVVSALRADPTTAALTVRDVYDARCVARLAERARRAEVAPDDPADLGQRLAGRPLQVAALQGLWLGVRLVAGSAALYIASFEVLPFLLDGLGAVPFLLLAPFLGVAVLALYAPVAIRTAAFAKKLLIGRYEPRCAPAWGSFYLRNWMVQQVVRTVPWRLLQGTEFFNAALRTLGARIGRRVHIHRGVDLLQGGWDLLTIGDDVTVAQDAALRLVELEDGQLIVGPVTLEDGCSLDVRAGVAPDTVIEREASLSALSSLPRGGRIPAGERWDGVPAAPVGRSAPPAPALPAGREFSPVGAGLLLVLARLGVRLLVLYLPLVGLAIGALLVYGVPTAAVHAWLVAPQLDVGVLGPLILVTVTDVVLSLALRAILCRALGTVRAGVIRRWSPAYVRLALKTEVVQAAGNWLSGTLFWPVWLRAAGMTVGRDCEISTIIDVVPELVTIGDECFLADGIYLGGARIDRGVVTLAATRLGRNTFIGNHAVIPGGTTTPDDVLIGVCTVADAARIRPGSSWFGHPAFALPRREIVSVERRLTHDPGPLRYATRVFWELLRVALPVGPLLVVLTWFEALARCAASEDPLAVLLVAAPLATLAAAAALCLAVLALKWVLLGRVRPGHHPLWSCWCSRWDFLYVAWTFYARGLLSLLEGTLYLPWFLRAAGSRIGRRVLLGGGFAQVVDPDMLAIEDEATVSGLFQAHSFEDRVLKIGRVTIGRQASVGSGAVLFYGAEIGERTGVAPHSVVMKHERLSPRRSYAGCPTGLVSRWELPAADRPGADGSRAPEAPSFSDRQPAIDAARGLALLGMMYMHLVPTSGGHALWERLATGLAWLLEAKSAALFCVLVGFALAILTQRARGSPRLNRYLLRRAFALGILGYAFGATLWTTEVIRPIAGMTLLAGFLARCRPRVILGVILLLLVATPVLAHVLHAYVETDWREDGTHVGALSFDGAGLRHLFFNGNYPLVPWLAFPLLGILLASIDWTRRRSAGTFFFGSLVVAVVSQLYAGWIESREDVLGALAPHLTMTWVPTSIPLVIMGASAATMVITGLLWWQRCGPPPGADTSILRALGRSTLTHYLLHIGIVFTILRLVHPDEEWPVGTGLLAYALYLLAAVPLTLWWFRRHRQGPGEALLARAAGPYRHDGPPGDARPR